MQNSQNVHTSIFLVNKIDTREGKGANSWKMVIRTLNRKVIPIETVSNPNVGKKVYPYLTNAMPNGVCMALRYFLQ